eukprot:Rhum_TRINITY_DN2999_c0_g2::Rhum_TRINITY_DN2999_c0_g2_i1::g.9119::m.9119
MPPPVLVAIRTLRLEKASERELPSVTVTATTTATGHRLVRPACAVAFVHTDLKRRLAVWQHVQVHPPRPLQNPLQHRGSRRHLRRLAALQIAAPPRLVAHRVLCQRLRPDGQARRRFRVQLVEARPQVPRRRRPQRILFDRRDGAERQAQPDQAQHAQRPRRRDEVAHGRNRRRLRAVARRQQRVGQRGGGRGETAAAPAVLHPLPDVGDVVEQRQRRERAQRAAPEAHRQRLPRHGQVERAHGHPGVAPHERRCCVLAVGAVVLVGRGRSGGVGAAEQLPRHRRGRRRLGGGAVGGVVLGGDDTEGVAQACLGGSAQGSAQHQWGGGGGGGGG